MPQPPDIASFAAANGLGAPGATHPARRLRPGRLGSLVLLVLLFLGGAVALLVVRPAVAWPAAAVSGAVGVAFLVLLLRTPNVSRSRARRAVYLFERGLVHVDGSGAPQAYRWDAVMSVKQRIVERKTTHTYLYTVARNDGTVLRLTEFYDRIAELGTVICEQVARVHLPHAYAAVERGETVPFGDLAVNAAGVVSVRHGVLPWSQLDAVTVAGGYVRLRRAGGWRPWSTTPAAEVPNLLVFLTLARGLGEAARRRVTS
jgi:hypothetical protein